MRALGVCALGLLAMLGSVDRAKADDVAAADPKGWTFGGAIRGRYDLRFDDANKAGQRETSQHVSFDTVLLKLDYDGSRFFGSAQYRIYGGSFIYGRSSGYREYPGEVRFPMYAYAGAKLTSQDKLTVGLQPVPFDDQFWGSAFLNSLGFVYGLEEAYDMGVVYSHAGDHLSFSTGYFSGGGPNGVGDSVDSSRYTVNLVKADAYLPGGTRTHEKDIWAGRVSWAQGDKTSALYTFQASAWLSKVHDYDTGTDNNRRAFALSARLDHGPWRMKVLGAWQAIDRPQGSSPWVSVGDYDAPFNIATRGTLAFAEVGRTIDTGDLPFTLDTYVDYSRFFKRSPGTNDSQRIDVGAYWMSKGNKHIRVYSELMVGRNDPFVGAGQYGNSGASGGDNRVKKSVMVIFGYYF